MSANQYVSQIWQTFFHTLISSIYRRQNLQKSKNYVLCKYSPTVHLAQAIPCLRTQFSFRFFYERPKLINLVRRKVKIMYKIICHKLRMSGEIIQQMTDRITMMFGRTLNRTNTFFLDELSTNLFYFTFTQLLIVEGSAFCLNKIFITMQTRKSLMTCRILSSFNNILAMFFTKIITFLILTNHTNLTSWTRHNNHLVQRSP